MDNLLVYGCSFTYGQGLADCNERPYPKPSQLGYAKLLESELNVNVLNYAQPGASNCKILYKILNTPIQSSDSVLIQWSFYNRSFIFFEDENKNGDIGPWGDISIIDKFYEVHSDKDLLMKSYLSIHHANMYLKTKCKNVYNLIISYDSIHKGIKPDWFDIKYLPISFYPILSDRASDGSHPGIKNNMIISKIVSNYIKRI